MARTVKITVSLAMPEETHEEYKKPTIEQRVKDALHTVDSGHESPVEWSYIKRIYRALRGKKGRRAQNLRDMIEPVLQKYDYQVDDRAE